MNLLLEYNNNLPWSLAKPLVLLAGCYASRFMQISILRIGNLSLSHCDASNLLPSRFSWNLYWALLLGLCVLHSFHYSWLGIQFFFPISLWILIRILAPPGGLYSSMRDGLRILQHFLVLILRETWTPEQYAEAPVVMSVAIVWWHSSSRRSDNALLRVLFSD